MKDYKFDKIVKQAYKEVYGVEIKKEEQYYDILNKDDVEKLESGLQMHNSAAHKMLGYAFFTQEDPRYIKKYENYDTLLLQLDSESDGNGDLILWGDAGVGNFFITKKALEEKDFSNVMYNWDCC